MSQAAAIYANDVAYVFMVVRYELVGTDLAGVRFAISPLNELVLSLRTLRDPGRFPLQLPWLRATESARAELPLDVLRALTNEALWTPDFLNPLPTPIPSPQGVTFRAPDDIEPTAF